MLKTKESKDMKNWSLNSKTTIKMPSPEHIGMNINEIGSWIQNNYKTVVKLYAIANCFYKNNHEFSAEEIVDLCLTLCTTNSVDVYMIAKYNYTPKWLVEQKDKIEYICDKLFAQSYMYETSLINFCESKDYDENMYDAINKFYEYIEQHPNWDIEA